MAEAIRAPRWMGRLLYIAAAYNIGWGALVVVAPGWWFRAADLPAPTYPALWQCIGMIVGVYGVGYAIAATDPFRHWPIVLVGLLGKIFGPIGFAYAAASGQLPWSAGAVIVTNDLVWWVPFALVLAGAHRASGARDVAPAGRLPDDVVDQDGRSLAAVSADGPTLAVFLRHFG